MGMPSGNLSIDPFETARILLFQLDTVICWGKKVSVAEHISQCNFALHVEFAAQNGMF